MEQRLVGTKYQIVRRLGEGGMGVVYQVVKPPNIQGVLKLMSAELTQHEELRVRFFDEVRILAQLDHPNIVKVFDYDALPDGTPYYVMEMLHGRTVRDALQTVGRMQPRIAYEITRQLLEALQCAHTNAIPVIHRDIKPDNIFLHAPKHGEPVVKLIDFGVSSLGDRKHDDAFVGTWGYAAPEQIRGERPTPQTDLYAVGLVLYEMLAGRGAFDHHPDWKMLSLAQLEELPAPVSHFAPWVPASIVELLAQTLSKDPRQRPRDAYAFAERLYDLEWASDGTKAKGETLRGNAPIAAMLTSIDVARNGDEPPIGVPAAAVQPSGGGVVIRAGSNPSLPHELVGPTTPRAASVRSVHDTFASQHSDPRPSQRSKTIGLVLLAAALLCGGLAITTALVIRSREKPVQTFKEEPTATPVIATPPPPIASIVPSAAPTPSLSVAPPPKPRASAAAAPKPADPSSRKDYAGWTEP